MNAVLYATRIPWGASERVGGTYPGRARKADVRGITVAVTDFDEAGPSHVTAKTSGEVKYPRSMMFSAFTSPISADVVAWQLVAALETFIAETSWRVRE